METQLHLRDSIFCVTIKDVKMADSLVVEEWPCHGAMKFPHVTYFRA